MYRMTSAASSPLALAVPFSAGLLILQVRVSPWSASVACRIRLKGVGEPSSSIVTVTDALSVMTGPSFTGVTSIVNVSAVGSRFSPPSAVPPSSSTWKVKLVYGAPLAFGAGVKVSLPAVISVTVTSCPAETIAPSSFSVPCPARVVTCTRLKLFAGLSSGSLNPKFVVVKA